MLHTWDNLKLCHLLDLNSMKIPLLHRSRQDSDAVNSLNSTTPMSNTETKSWIVPNFSFRLIYQMQSTREPSCKSTYLTAWHSKGHSMSHRRSRFTMPHGWWLSGEPDIDYFNSSELHWYVQTNNGMNIVIEQPPTRGAEERQKGWCHKSIL